MHIMGCMTIDMRHVTGDWVTFNDFALPGNMPHGNNYDSLNMNARYKVSISRDLQWQGKYFKIKNQVCSMHIMGCMTISMRHVTSDWVTFNDFQRFCLMETAMAPLLCMLETLFAYQEFHNDNGNSLRYKPGV